MAGKFLIPNQEDWRALSRFVAESGSVAQAARHLGMGATTLQNAVNAKKCTSAIRAKLVGMGRLK